MEQTNMEIQEEILSKLKKREALTEEESSSLYSNYQNLHRERDTLAFIISRTKDCCNSMLQLAKKYELQNDESDQLLILKLKNFLKNSELEEISYDLDGKIVIQPGGENDGDITQRKHGIEKLEDLMTDFFIQLRTKSINVFDMIGGDQKICSNFIKYLSKESDSLLETMKIQIENLLVTLPEKVVVIKEHLKTEEIPLNFEDNLISKARNISKNLRSALSEADCVKTDPAEDREFDYIWNKLHEDAETSVEDSTQKELVQKLEMLLGEKQRTLEKMEEEFETQKMLHDREVRDVKKQNDMLVREVKNLKKELTVSPKPGYSYFGNGNSEYKDQNFDDLMKKNSTLNQKIKQRDNEINGYETKINYLNKRIKELERVTGINNETGRKKKEEEALSIDPSFLDSMRQKPKTPYENKGSGVFNGNRNRYEKKASRPSRYTENNLKENTENPSRVLRPNPRNSNNQPIHHDQILESYLKKGVYRTMSKSPIKRSLAHSRAPENNYDFSKSIPKNYQNRKSKKKMNTDLKSIETWAYFDKRKSQYNFMKRTSNKVRLGSPSKHTVYEKNRVTGEPLLEKSAYFDKILCAESENHMVNTLGKAVIESLSKSGSSFLLIGKNDKLFLLQLVLRLLIDELATRGTGHFTLQCSQNMASILETFFGDDDPNLPRNTFKVEASLFDLFGQVSDRLDEHMTSDEFFCKIEFLENRFSNPVTLVFAGCSPVEGLKKYMPSRNNEMDQYTFLRQSILQNFKNSTDNTSLTMLVDKFLSLGIKFVCTFTHLVDDYLFNDFLIDVSSGMKNERERVLTPNNRSQGNKGQPQRHRRDVSYGGKRPVYGSGGKVGDRRIENKVKEASDHVRNIFRYIH